METTELDAIRGDLVSWGLLDEGSARLAWSRRFRGAVMRQAAGLAELERAGEKPDGHPLEVAVRTALSACELPDGAVPTPSHERFLIAVEVAELPEGVLDLIGRG